MMLLLQTACISAILFAFVFLGDHYSMIPQWLPLSQVFCSRQKKKEKRLGKEPTTFVHFCGIGKFSGPL